MSSSFGHAFRITTWGESHGGGVGVVIDGCPPGLPLDAEDIQFELDEVSSGARALTELDFLGPAEREHRRKIKAEQGETGLKEVSPEQRVKDFKYFIDLEVKVKSAMRRAFATERQKERKAAQHEKQLRANRFESILNSVN